MTLLIFHECGHFLAGKLFGWKIDKIYIYPLGGVTKFNDKINKPFIEEFIVTIMGPLFQITLASFLQRYFSIVIIINRVLLLFNLLPIVPLDGGKLISLLLQRIVPYYKNLNITLIISYISYLITILFILYNFTSLFYIIVVFLLIFKINDEMKLKKYYFNKFLIERSIYNFKFKKTKVIDNIYHLYKYKNNIFNINGRLYNEKEVITRHFKIM